MADKKRVIAPPSLVGKKVYLRPTTPEDVANVHHWRVLSEPQTLSCRPMPFHTAKEASEGMQRKEKSTSEQRFTVVRKDDNTPVAMVSYFDLNTQNRSAELGLMVDPDERQRGYGSEAMKLLVHYLFQYRGLNKVYGQTAAFNAAAVAVFESLGFKKDATLRDHYFLNGEFHHGYIYTLLQFEADW